MNAKILITLLSSAHAFIVLNTTEEFLDFLGINGRAQGSAFSLTVTDFKRVQVTILLVPKKVYQRYQFQQIGAPP